MNEDTQQTEYEIESVTRAEVISVLKKHEGGYDEHGFSTDVIFEVLRRVNDRIKQQWDIYAISISHDRLRVTHDKENVVVVADHAQMFWDNLFADLSFNTNESLEEIVKTVHEVAEKNYTGCSAQYEDSAFVEFEPGERTGETHDETPVWELESNEFTP